MTLDGLITADARYLCGSWASCQFVGIFCEDRETRRLTTNRRR